MKVIRFFILFVYPFLFCLQSFAIDSKGAIIIASLEGQVSVQNNETGIPLSADRVKVGGMIFDGHTVETGKGSKVVLLFSSGTITTLKEESVLNIKKFAQQKFDPSKSGKLSARKDEPSPSETVIDLSLGDMVVDVKKLKKESSFNIDSPVGTAGIRGTIPRIQVAKLPGGGFNQTTQMLKGKISYMPKGGGRPTMLGPGQSLASGISASGMTLPIKIGRVPAAVMKAIQAEVDQASAATGKAAEGPPPTDTPESNPEEEAPAEDELIESDSEMQASQKGVGGGDDDNGTGTEALALEKANIIDLDNPEDKEKVKTFSEVAKVSAVVNDENDKALSEFKEAEQNLIIAKESGDDSAIADAQLEFDNAKAALGNEDFIKNIASNFNNVVDVTEESEDLGLKDTSKIRGFAENSDQSGDLLSVLGDADEIGAKNAENMDAVFSNPDKASNLKKVIDVAKDAFASDRRSSDGGDEVTQDGKDTMTAMFRTAEKANEVAEVVASAESTKSSDAGKSEKKIKGVFKVVKSVDKAEQDKKAADAEAAEAAAEAAAKKAAEAEAARKAAEELAAAQAAGDADAIAAAQAEADRVAKRKAAVDDYSGKLNEIKAATDSASVDAILEDFNGAHDADVLSLLIADGLDLNIKADTRRAAIKAEASAAQKENVFGNLGTVTELAVASIEVEEQAAAEAAEAAAAQEQAAAALQAAQDAGDADAIARAEAQKAKAERAKAAAEAKAADTGFDNMIENADQASELKKMVDKNAEIEAAAQKAKEEAAAALESAKASGDAIAIAAAEAAQAEADAAAENKADLGSLLKNADKAKDLVKVVEKAEELGTSGDTSTLTALLKNPEQAKSLAKVIDDSVSSSDEGEAVQDTAKLNVLFNVVKSSDAKKVAAAAAAEKAEEAGAFVPFETEELILAATDKQTLKGWKNGVIGDDDFSGNLATLELLNTLIDNRLEEINSQSVFEKIDTVVEVAKSVQENGGGSNLDSILDNAEKADDLKVLVDQAVTSGGEDGAASLLTNVLDNAEKATELSEVVSSAADEGVDVTKLLENAKEADNLLKAKQAADAVELDSAKKKAIELAPDLTDAINASETIADLDVLLASLEDVAAKVREAKKVAKKEVLESVAANAENAESVATVLDAAANADAETKAALLRNAEQAVAMAETIKEERAIEAEAAKVEVDSETKAALDTAIAAIKTAANSAGVDAAVQSFKDTLDTTDIPESLQKLADSRRKSLNLITVVKQVDDKKQVAKAVAAEAANAQVSDEFKALVNAKETTADLKQVLLDNLPAEVTDQDLKGKIFKAKTAAAVRTLLDEHATDYSEEIVQSVLDHWRIVFPKKEEITAALAFQSIDTLAEVAGKTTGDDGEVNLDGLDAVLENVEKVEQLAVLIESEDAGSGTSLLDTLASGEDVDFEEVLATGALGTLQNERFLDLGINFNQFYEVDESTSISLSSDKTSLADITSEYQASPESITDSSGGTVYSLTAEQVNELTGSTDGVAGIYSFAEVLNADTGDPEGVVIYSASKKIGVAEYESFSVDTDRAGDILFVLDSPAIKVQEADSDDVKAEKAQLRDAFLSNVDQLDNLLELNKVIGDDQAKVKTAFNNLSSLGDLVAISDNLRFDENKLNLVYIFLDDTEKDSLTKSTEIGVMRSLTDKFATAPNRLNAIFSEDIFSNTDNKLQVNTGKLEVLDDLTSRLDRNVEGVTEEKGQINMLFNNLDYADDFLSIVNRFEGTKRDTVLQDIRSLITSNPSRKDIIFANPSQVGSLRKLYQEFKFEPARVEVIFEFASKADAFLDVLNDLRATGGGLQLLFNDPEGTMADIGFTKLISEYPEKYHAIFEENKEISAELSSTASKFKSNPEYLDLVFANIDKLEEINGFANEFGSLNTVPVLNQDGEIVIDEQTGEEKTQEVFVFSDPLLTSIFFKNIEDLSNLFSFKEVGEIVGIPGGAALRIFDKEPGWLFFVVGENVIDRDDDDRPLLNDEQKAAARFLGNLYLTDVPVTEVPLELARELFALELSKEELGRVIIDLLDGPLLDGPESAPPGENDPGANADLQTLSFLMDHSFTGSIDPSLIISAEIAMASSFFSESMTVFEELSFLGQSSDQYVPQGDDHIIDPGEDGSFTASEYDGSYDPANDPNYVDGSTDPNNEFPNDHLDDGLDVDGILGGHNLTFGAGTYDLSQLAYDRLLFAASETLSLGGSLTFTVDQTEGIHNELILLSAGGIRLEAGSSLRYEGESLGLGSFNTLRIIEVDLYAQDEISLRSLDRLVIQNSNLATSGRGVHDAVELLAYQEISVDNLQFSEHVKRIAMEAMTVNLSNLNFPSGSQVKLNSAYGGIDGKYPNFNSILYGRVNFIQNIRYANNLMMDRPSFDQFGGSVSIGRIGN